MNVLVRILGFQEQQLRHRQIGHVILDLTDDEDHALLEQTRVDVEGALATRGLLHHHRHQLHQRPQGGMILIVHDSPP